MLTKNNEKSPSHHPHKYLSHKSFSLQDFVKVIIKKYYLYNYIILIQIIIIKNKNFICNSINFLKYLLLNIYLNKYYVKKFKLVT